MPRPGSPEQKRIARERKASGWCACVWVDGGGSFLVPSRRCKEDRELWGGRGGRRSGRLYLRSLRSTAANRLPFPLSFLLASLPSLLVVNFQESRLLAICLPFRCFTFRPPRSLVTVTSFVHLRLRLTHSLSFSRLYRSLPIFLQWRFVDRMEQIHYETSMFSRGNVAIALYTLSFSRPGSEVKVLDNKRNRLVTVVFRSRRITDKKQARVGNSCGRER